MRPAGGAVSRKNLLRTMPWYPCNSINTAIREISPSAADRHILHRTLTIVQRYLFVVSLDGTFLPCERGGVTKNI
jgi:hypothetical protein